MKPNCFGGLGLRDSRMMNTVLLAKNVARMALDSQAI